MALELLLPDWDAPAAVGAAMSTRRGGVSAAPFDTLNLRLQGSSGAGTDVPQAVRENRHRFTQALAARPVWLDQVHGALVQRIDGSWLDKAPPRADASVSTEPGVACAVLVADCLPVLMCTADGRAVAAAHAGWRGLALGVLENTVRALCDAASCAPGQVRVWLGPCIGPRHFEVGVDVVEAFGGGRHFAPRPRPDGAMRWLADLPALARDRLTRAAVTKVSGGLWCTVEDGSRFFSFRRDGLTGRMAAAVWRRAG